MLQHRAEKRRGGDDCAQSEQRHVAFGLESQLCFRFFAEGGAGGLLRQLTVHRSLKPLPMTALCNDFVAGVDEAIGCEIKAEDGQPNEPDRPHVQQQQGSIEAVYEKQAQTWSEQDFAQPIAASIEHRGQGPTWQHACRKHEQDAGEHGLSTPKTCFHGSPKHQVDSVFCSQHVAQRRFSLSPDGGV